MTAELVADAEHGTTFNGPPVVWPRGYTGRRVGSEIEVLSAGGNVRATTGRRYFISRAYIDPLATDRYPAAMDCPYAWDFGECDASGEPVLPADIPANEIELWKQARADAVAANC